jgi:spermidine/putrescine transport system substrate-binding protein
MEETEVMAASYDPRVNALTSALTSALSRRRFLQATGAVGAAVALSPALAACGGGASAAGDSSAVNWSNWPSYMDGDEEKGTYPSIQKFTKDTGVKVKYAVDINDNEEFLSKVRPQLEKGQDINRDLVVLTDWMAATWIEKGWAQKFDAASVPNKTNLVQRLQNVPFDPNRDYTLPWQSGFAGLGWNTSLLKDATGKTELKSVEELWDPKLKGKISVLTEMRDTIGVIMASQGANPADFKEDDFNKANAELQKQIDSGQVLNASGNDYLTALTNGEVIAVIGWSGDVLALGKDYGFALPESGGTLWSDNMFIPAKAKNAKEAAKVMNFYYDPQNAATVAASVQYLCPVEGAQDAMKKVDASLADSPWIFPSEETFSKAVVFKTLTNDEQDKYNRAFQSAIGN